MLAVATRAGVATGSRAQDAASRVHPEFAVRLAQRTFASELAQPRLASTQEYVPGDEVEDMVPYVLLHRRGAAQSRGDVRPHLVPGAPDLRVQVAPQRLHVLVERLGVSFLPGRGRASCPLGKAGSPWGRRDPCGEPCRLPGPVHRGQDDALRSAHALLHQRWGTPVLGGTRGVLLPVPPVRVPQEPASVHVARRRGAARPAPAGQLPRAVLNVRPGTVRRGRRPGPVVGLAVTLVRKSFPCCPVSDCRRNVHRSPSRCRKARAGV